MSQGVSIVICCHNSAKRLSETLRHLAVQQVSPETPWEVLLIDNSSTDDTVETARRCWPTKPPAPLRVVAEPKLGVGQARFRSFTEARYEIISFVDDDNWVGPAWVENVAGFFAQHPDASAVGGPSRAIFESTPPLWFAAISRFCAIGDQHAFTGDITGQPGTLLWTAGMSLRKAKALELLSLGFRFYACGGSSLPLKTGEDTELCFALRAQGGRIYYEPGLGIEHFMPADRLTWPKALRLLWTMGASSVLFDLYLIALEKHPYDKAPAWKKTWLFQTLKTGRYLWIIFWSQPGDCFRQTEGSSPALFFQKELGRLTTLWAIGGQFQNLVKNLKSSAWNKDEARTGI